MGRQYKAQDFIDAMPGTGGIISAIARKVGCEWSTAHGWIMNYPTVKQAYDNECESMLDLAESTVLKSIKDGDTADAKWYLTKKGKRRGFGDNIEVTGKDGNAIEVDYTILSDEERVARIESILHAARARRDKQAPPNADT